MSKIKNTPHTEAPAPFVVSVSDPGPIGAYRCWMQELVASKKIWWRDGTNSAWILLVDTSKAGGFGDPSAGVVVGQATEADIAQQIRAQKRRTLGIATETDAALGPIVEA